MRAAVALMQAKRSRRRKWCTHILGLNAAGETTLDLPAVGGEKLVYTGKAFPLTPLQADRRSRTGSDCGTSPWDLVPGGLKRICEAPRGGYYA